MRWTCSLREMEVRAFINNGANASLGNPKVSKRKAGRNTCLRTIEMPQRFFSSLHDSQDFQPSARSKEKADTHRNYSRTVASGGNIFLIRAKDRADEISKVVNLVSQLLNGKLDDQQIGATKFDFADIGIIYQAHRNRDVLITESLIPRLKVECNAPVVWVSDPRSANNRFQLSYSGSDHPLRKRPTVPRSNFCMGRPIAVHSRSRCGAGSKVILRSAHASNRAPGNCSLRSLVIFG